MQLTAVHVLAPAHEIGRSRAVIERLLEVCTAAEAIHALAGQGAGGS